MLSAWPVPVSYGGDRAFYLPQLDRIQLPERASFHSPRAFYATWAHEQVHSTGHSSRLKRDLGGSFGKPRYAREELVAELGAVLLGDRLEIGSELQSHAPGAVPGAGGSQAGGGVDCAGGGQFRAGKINHLLRIAAMGKHTVHALQSSK